MWRKLVPPLFSNAGSGSESSRDEQKMAKNYFYTKNETQILLKRYSRVEVNLNEEFIHDDTRLVAHSPSEFAKDFNRDLFSFYILKSDGAREQKKITIPSDESIIQNFIESFFGSGNETKHKASQFQKMGQGYFFPIFERLQKMIKDFDGNPDYHQTPRCELFKIPGNSQSEDRLIVRLHLILSKKDHKQKELGKKVCSFDEVYELGFTDRPDKEGPAFYLVQGTHPILTIYDSSMLDKSHCSFADMEHPLTQYMPEDRLHTVLQATAKPRSEFKVDFNNPVFIDIQSTKKEKTIRELNVALETCVEKKEGVYSRLLDGTNVASYVREGILPIFSRISDECVLDVTDFINAIDYAGDSIFDENRNLHSWVGNLCSESVSLEEKTDFAEYVRTIYVTARDGVLLKDGSFSGWLRKYFGETLFSKVEKEIGIELLRCHCITTAALRLATALSENIEKVHTKWQKR